MQLRIELGSAPPNEDCAQVGTDGYEQLAKDECARHAALIRKKLGPEPAGARLTTDSMPHDLGTYYETVCLYDADDEVAAAYAYACESNGPRSWSDEEPFDWRAGLDAEPASDRRPQLSPDTVDTARPF